MAKARGLPAGYRQSDPLVLFRPIPGTRRYYNPSTYETVSEHFVLRKYRPSRSAADRENIRESGQRERIRTVINRRSFASQYRLKVESEGFNWTRANELRLRELYDTVQQSKIEVKNAKLEGRNVDAEILNRRDGEYAKALEELGRRDVNADYLVGESPKNTVDRLAQEFNEVI